MSRILILSSDRQISRHTASFLESKGYQVSVHSDPQQAITDTDGSHPDLVITDLLLAGRSGAEFLYELRSYPEWQAIPVIITGVQSATEISNYLPAFGELKAVYLPMPTTSYTELAEHVQSLLPAKVAA
jgi:DNA-binding response OmpR family regulator